MTKWSKSIVHWRGREKNTVFVSVVFTWHLPKAHVLCQWNRQAGRDVIAGGPAVDLMPAYLADVATCPGPILNSPSPLSRHNPLACFTTRGCIRQCDFCAVPRIEGEFRELAEWTPAPIVCDNNLLAASQPHFNRVVDSLKPFSHVDFNQGLDVRLLRPWHLDRLRELHLVHVRFSWDWLAEEAQVMDAISWTLAAGVPRKRITVYVLVGHSDTPEDALYRMRSLKARGIKANPMRYQPLNALAKDMRDSHVSPTWSDSDLTRFVRYWSRQNWFSKIPFEQFGKT